MPGINAYNTTSFIESNIVANRAILELGGYAAPNVMMANNKVEARERAEKAAMFFSFSLLLPVACVPFLNRIFLKFYNITDKLNDKGVDIVRLPKKYLTKDANYMMEGVGELKKGLRNKKNYDRMEKGIDHVLKKFSDKEKLRKLLVKANNKILVSDFLITGACLSSIYWVSNYITRMKTGRHGFSAEFEMADKEIVEDKAKKFKDKQKRNQLIAFGILLSSALGLNFALNKGMLSKNMKSGFSNFIKRHASKFDYKDGMYMSRLTFFLIAMLGDIPSTMLASRDKDELKYNIIKNSFFNGLFFGGDLVLNNVAAHYLDKHYKTRLVKTENAKPTDSWLKKMTRPIYSLDELNKITTWDKETLRRTKKFGAAMFWGNFLTILAILGFGTPILLNSMVRKSVEKDVQKYNQAKNENSKG